MTENKIEELLLQMSADIAEIKIKVNADYRALYGNGHPGLLDQVNELDKRVSAVEHDDRNRSKTWVVVGSIAAFLLSTAINIIGMFFGR